MKKILKLRSAFLLLMSLIFSTACSVAEGGLPSDVPQLMPFSIVVDGDTPNSVTATVNYNSQSIAYPYFVGVVESSIYDSQLKGDHKAILSYAKESAPSANFITLEVDDNYIFKGSSVINISSIWELVTGSEYYIYAFAMDVETGEIITNIELKPLTIAALPANQIASVSTSELASSNFKVSVDAGTYSGAYVLYIASEQDYIDADMDADKLVGNLIDQDVATFGTSIFATVDNAFIFKGDGELNAGEQWYIFSDSKYYAVAAGIEYSAEEITITTPAVISKSVVTPELEPSAITLEAGALSINSIEVDLLTNGYSGRYAIFATKTSQFEAPIDEQGLNGDSSYAVELYTYFYVVNNIVMNKYSGDQSHTITEDFLFSAIEPNTEYTVLAFGIDEDNMVLSSGVTLQVTTPSEAISAPRSRVAQEEIGDGNFTIPSSPQRRVK